MYASPTGIHGLQTYYKASQGCSSLLSSIFLNALVNRVNQALRRDIVRFG